MTTRLSQQAAAFALALVMTLAAMATIDTAAEVERHGGFAHVALTQQAAAKA